MLVDALKTATNKAEHRVLSAQLAFEIAAHYQRLAKFDDLDDFARSFALRNIDFHKLRGTLLLTGRTDEQINTACATLLKQPAQQQP